MYAFAHMDLFGKSLLLRWVIYGKNQTCFKIFKYLNMQGFAMQIL